MHFNNLKKIGLVFFCTPVLANPGSYTVNCQAKTPHAIKFSITRMNDINWQAPKFSLNMDKKQFKLSSPDASKTYGETVKDIPLRLIYLTATNMSYPKNNYTLVLKGIPNSVKSNSKVKWSLQQQKNPCYDKNGNASFKSILSGQVTNNGKTTKISPTLLQCTIEYDSGMSC
jgi:hypothetical protein